MVLGRKVDDEVGLHQTARVEYEHLTRAYLSCLARGRVSCEVRGPLVLELQGNAFAHDAHAVHRVDDRIHVVLLEQVALCQLDHGEDSLEVPALHDIDPQWYARLRKKLLNMRLPLGVDHAEARHAGQ